MVAYIKSVPVEEMMHLVNLMFVLLPLLQAGEIKIRYINAHLWEAKTSAVSKKRLIHNEAVTTFPAHEGCFAVKGELRYAGRYGGAWERSLAERWVGWFIGRMTHKTWGPLDREWVYYQFIPTKYILLLPSDLTPLTIQPFLEDVFRGGCVADHPKFIAFVQSRYHPVIH